MRFHFLILGCLLFAFVSCSKKETATTTSSSNASIDTSQKAEPVKITDTSHHLYFRPQAGAVRRYHIVDHVVRSSEDTAVGAPPRKQAISVTTEIYLRETIKGPKNDSLTEFSVRIDSLTVASTVDTTTMHYSSSNLKDRANDQYQELNLVVGKEFSAFANKYGDLDSIVDVGSLTTAMLATLPDSMKRKPQMQQFLKQQAEQLAIPYIVRVLTHCPTLALVQDTTWRHTEDGPIQIPPSFKLPVHITESETVRGLERRNDKVLAVLEDSMTTVPTKNTLTDGQVVATISGFSATTHRVVRIEDSTGFLYHQVQNEKRNFTFHIQSKDHPNENRTLVQHGSEDLLTEQLQ